MKEVIQAASTYSRSASDNKPTRITRIQLHVHTANIDGRRFYEKHGFKVVKEITAYYKKIEPRSAWLLEREVRAEPNA